MSEKISRRAGVLVLFVVFPVAWFWLFTALDPGTESIAGFEIDTGEYAVSGSDEPPRNSAAWQETPFPAWVSIDERSYATTGYGSVWVRVALDGLPQTPETALYIPTPAGNLNVYLDDLRILSTGANETPLGYRRHPVRAVIDGQMIDVHQHLYIHVTRESSELALGRFYLGPPDPIATHDAQLSLARHTLPSTISVILLSLAVLLGVLALFNPREKAYAWLGVTLVLWPAHVLSMQVEDVPFAYDRWIVVIYILNIWVVAVAIAFHHFYEFRTRIPIYVLSGITVILASGLILTGVLGDGDDIRWYGSYVWVAFAMSCALFTVFQHVFAVYREASFESVGLLLHGYTAMIIGTRDYLFDTGAIPGWFEYLPIYGAFSILFFVVLLARRFVHYQKRATAFNAELERRVDEISAELESNYAALSKSERERAVMEERGRITRDMHDGLGGQLMHALQLAERIEATDAPKLSASLKYALQDLRLIIDAMAPRDNDLVTLLASFRHRTRGQLEDCGIALHWVMEDLPRITLAPTEMLHLLRILQEVVTNSMRHAGAHNIRFDTSRAKNDVVISIEDDGAGFDTAHVEQRGLKNVEKRAEQIGARLVLQSSDEGTRITLRLPDVVPESGSAPR